MNTETLISALSNVNINSESAVEIARIWQQVQYISLGSLTLVFSCSFIAVAVIVVKVMNSNSL